MRLLRRSALLTAAVLVAVGTAGPAAAAPPRPGECPVPYTAADQSQLAQALADATPEDDVAEDHQATAAGAFARYDRNADGLLCYIPIGKVGYVNVIDDVVRGRA
ncbi:MULTISPECIES: hypothetical protein [unclassified Geodermatophilus]